MIGTGGRTRPVSRIGEAPSASPNVLIPTEVFHHSRHGILTIIGTRTETQTGLSDLLDLISPVVTPSVPILGVVAPQNIVVLSGSHAQTAMMIGHQVKGMDRPQPAPAQATDVVHRPNTRTGTTITDHEVDPGQQGEAVSVVE